MEIYEAHEIEHCKKKITLGNNDFQSPKRVLNSFQKQWLKGKNTVDIQYNDAVGFYYNFFQPCWILWHLSVDRDSEWGHTVKTVYLSSIEHFSGLIVSICFINNGVLLRCFLHKFPFAARRGTQDIKFQQMWWNHPLYSFFWSSLSYTVVVFSWLSFAQLSLFSTYQCRTNFAEGSTEMLGHVAGIRF